VTSAKKQKIVIDARPLSRPRSGIRRYLESVLLQLLEKSETEWLLYSDLPLQSDILDGHSITVRIAGKGNYSRLMWHWHVYRWLCIDKPEVYWTPRHHLPLRVPKFIRKVVTTHDLVWRTHPDTMQFRGKWAEKILTARSLKQAHAIIAVSQATADDIQKYYPSAGGRVIVIRHGWSELPVPSPPFEWEKYLDEPFFLSVGTIEPRKNYPILVKAYQKYLQYGGEGRLVIIGNKGWGWKKFRKLLANSPSSAKIEFVENCNDSNLAWFYSNACAFVMISLAEGYGLPVIEAMEIEY
jgi:glycosyltransferase involved in cell wall biosynthesis